MIPTIDCIILNYNDACRTIETAKYLSKYEIVEHIIVVDNQSTDNSFERIKKEQIRKMDAISSYRNGGYGYGNNYGVKWAVDNYDTAYALIINPDVVVSEETLKELVMYLSMHRDYAVVSCKQILPNGKENISCWSLPKDIEIIFSGGLIGAKLRSSREKLLQNTEPTGADVDCVAGSLLLIDTQKFLQFGGYDEDFFLYMEETVLGEKTAKAGWKSRCLTNVSYLHEHSATISKVHGIRSRRRILTNSRTLFLKKYRNNGPIVLFCTRIIYSIGTIEILVKNCIRELKRMK